MASLGCLYVKIRAYIFNNFAKSSCKFISCLIPSSFSIQTDVIAELVKFQCLQNIMA